MDKNQEKEFDLFLNNFKKQSSKIGFKNTIQKDYILKTLFISKKHLTAEDILKEIKEKYNLNTGIVTIYNTIKFFHRLNFITLLDIGDGTFRYEFNHKNHHDHLVCTNCNLIKEFTDDFIEEQQQLIAKNNRYKLQNHIMILYGICEECQKLDSNS
ncbi:Fur family transcriptional regulator [Aliarcobacter lanthieri]|uniref:Fur family transcriptional regulator n=1 Tax=Aliarcobacter lanthieri TaxID=1355374 RepID=UPI00047A4501|nr:transcriptional repressor [Aliarcobacter lanthieri]QKF58792.1 transcriptional regulator, Fur family [Aliarcobacter lanthieri]